VNNNDTLSPPPHTRDVTLRPSEGKIKLQTSYDGTVTTNSRPQSILINSSYYCCRDGGDNVSVKRPLTDPVTSAYNAICSFYNDASVTG
jgi:hypothetical protein